jgi:hypothetical protein
MSRKAKQFDYSVLSHDWRPLYDMLSYHRQAGSKGEKLVIQRYIEPICGKPDMAGNYTYNIGDSPIMWSCHTDTVHRTDKSSDGKQPVYMSSTGMLHTAGSNCLGADDGAGMALMLAMIQKRIPGRYVFHRGEECGGIGSSHIAEMRPKWLDKMQACIAFDRYGYSDIITHQGGRTASEAFALSLAQCLNAAQAGFSYKPSRHGIFTDSANYSHLVPECTNVSVGYHGHHGAGETQDIRHLDNLLSAILAADFSKLTFAREPAADDWLYYANDSKPALDNSAMVRMIRENPEDVAEILLSLGLSEDDLAAELWDRGAVLRYEDFS